MKLALRLGAKGKGSTFPNPPVGAVIVKDGRIIGRGWHRRSGEQHAEVDALTEARLSGEKLAGSTMFVTLEPCCHHGKTPPCTDAIIRAKIGRVVVSCRDEFDDRMCGKGIERLRDAGIKVETGLLGADGAELIEQYRIQRTERRAFLTVKWAQSLDGRIATASGDSKWISGERARRFAHRLRSQHGAVAVGAKTAIIDDPLLTVRGIRSHHEPARIVLAGDRELPSRLKILSGGPRTIVVRDDAPAEGRAIANNVEFLNIPAGKDFWKRLLFGLFERGIGSVMLEGGGRAITSALRERMIDRLYCIISPTIIGKGIEAVGDLGIDSISGAIEPENIKIIRLGHDIILTGFLLRP